jgi:hypothetical protein
MMSSLTSATAAPLPGFARAAVFALAAIMAVGAVQLWHHGAATDATASATTAPHAAQPLAAAPSPADMWRF